MASQTQDKEKSLTHLRTLVPPNEVFDESHPSYHASSAPWSTHEDRHPTLVLQPSTLETLTRLVPALYASNLDFAVRNTGTGSVSARDVILSTQGLKGFVFNPADETVTLGSGFSWGEVDALMEEHAPGYAVVGARCGWVGVTGSALVGGLSWLSHEFGLISDPENLLDMQIVLRDGRAVWAGEADKELMWALRGGGGNFGVVTALQLQARRYTTQIFTGRVFLPYSALHEVSKAVAMMAARPADPKLAMHVTKRGSGLGEAAQGGKPGIAIYMYDANGEAHGRSEAGFAWVFRIAGAEGATVGVRSLREMHAMANSFLEWRDTSLFHWSSAPLIAEIDEQTLLRAWEWWEESFRLCEGFQEGSTVILEFMQEAAMCSSGGRSKTGWPHHGRRHVMQIVLGCKPEAAPANIREIAMKQLAKAGAHISGPHEFPKEYHAGFLQEWNDLDEVYGENLPRLQEVKRKYDPQNRFNKGVDLMSEKVRVGPVA